MFTNIFFAGLNKGFIKALEVPVPVPVEDASVSLNRQIVEEIDILCPLNEVTGLRDSVITQIMDPALSPLERERLMSTLQRMPASKRNSLSDTDLMNLVESRYNSTYVDVEKFADDLRRVVDEVNAADASVSAEDSDDSAGSSDSGSSE